MTDHKATTRRGIGAPWLARFYVTECTCGWRCQTRHRQVGPASRCAVKHEKDAAKQKTADA